MNNNLKWCLLPFLALVLILGTSVMACDPTVPAASPASTPPSSPTPAPSSRAEQDNLKLQIEQQQQIINDLQAQQEKLQKEAKRDYYYSLAEQYEVMADQYYDMAREAKARAQEIWDMQVRYPNNYGFRYSVTRQQYESQAFDYRRKAEEYDRQASKYRQMASSYR